MSAATVLVHPTQFPENIRLALRESLRTRRINHKFHYDSARQAQKWLAVHAAFSPAQTDSDCARIYDQAFAAATQTGGTSPVHVIGLGCGGGQKDVRLLELLKPNTPALFYTPCDVSVALVLTARQAATRILAEDRCLPFVCDLAEATDAAAFLSHPHAGAAARLITFFGMIPNFEPGEILPRLTSMVGPRDRLLFSANLAPGSDYAEGVKAVLPLYDNPPTREWLAALLFDLGLEGSNGTMHFDVETDRSTVTLLRIVAHWEFSMTCRITVDDEVFEFRPGDRLRLFFSYRHTPELIRQLLAAHGLQVREQWVTKSGEEGVFLCARTVDQ